jgi:hypothetical protein
LKGERILFFFQPRARAVEELANRLLSHRLLDLGFEGADFRIDVALRREFSQELPGKLIIAFVRGFLDTLDAQTDLGGIETLNRLVAERLLKRVGKLTGARKPVGRLLRHRLVNHAAQKRTDRRIDLRSRRWYEMGQGLRGGAIVFAGKWLPSG